MSSASSYVVSARAFRAFRFLLPPLGHKRSFPSMRRNKFAVIIFHPCFITRSKCFAGVPHRDSSEAAFLSTVAIKGLLMVFGDAHALHCNSSRSLLFLFDAVVCCADSAGPILMPLFWVSRLTFSGLLTLACTFVPEN